MAGSIYIHVSPVLTDDTGSLCSLVQCQRFNGEGEISQLDELIMLFYYFLLLEKF